MAVQSLIMSSHISLVARFDVFLDAGYMYDAMDAN